ncbi:MAG: exosome complex RNA-binding protein Csl4 [Candidatus Nitrosoabyssus spongiisocia]|nr:MAG: exosome complex RNA-binding protein Csl4 [Nitrosopumilaceae archaeon AB1(1)]
MSEYQPGNKVATIEEYEMGKNVYDDNGIIRSAVVGKSNVDTQEHSISVNNPKLLSVPKKDDIVIGVVAIVMSSMLAVSIRYINGKPVTSHTECICSIRNIRKRVIALANDIVKVKIIGENNGAIHASIAESGFGVLLTKCRKCGKEVLPFKDAIKCTECSWIDNCKLADDFTSEDFLSAG